MITTDDPREQAKQMFQEARQALAAHQDQVLARVHVGLLAAFDLDPVARDAVWRDLRWELLGELDHQLPLRNLKAALLEQALREARSALKHPDETTVDLEALFTRMDLLLGS